MTQLDSKLIGNGENDLKLNDIDSNCQTKLQMNRNQLKTIRIDEQMYHITQLEQNENLSSTDKKWINSYTLVFKKSPTSFSQEMLQNFDALSPHLGYRWRVGLGRKRPLIFNKSLDEILNRLEKNQSLLSVHKEWINGHRLLYLKNSEKFSKERRQQLDELNTYLGFDWKLRGGFENEALIKNTTTL